MNHQFMLRAITTTILSFATPILYASFAPHAAVSNDGKVVYAPNVARGVGGGVNGEPPKLAKGETLDSQAEYPAFVMTSTEMQDLKHNFKPATSGRLMPSSVLGAIDSRYRIYPSASGHPERAIGQITSSQNGKNYICTGWLISPNTVITAGHCVHTGGSNGVWSTNVKFFPGRDATNNPYGSCTAKSLHSVQGWTKNNDTNYDYGAIKLNCTIGNSTGTFGFFWQSASLVGLPIQVSGYPGDKPAGTQWSTSGDIDVSDAKKIQYKHDSFGGQSGGPVFQTDRVGSFCTGVCASAIHTNGGTSVNKATRIDQSVYNNMIYWKNLP